MRFDSYTLLARIAPIVILFLPVAAAVAVWIPGGLSIIGLLTSTAVTIALAFLASQLGRDAGYLLQTKLWESWGGAPTTQVLRHRGPTNPHLLRRYHEKLSTLCGKPFPSMRQERNTPENADRIYEAAVALLRERTRDCETFPLVFKENVNYGFRRNLYGLKGTGIVLSLTSTTITCVHATLHHDPASWILMGILAFFVAFWLIRVNSDWVKIPAFAYARALLEACDRLDFKPLESHTANK